MARPFMNIPTVRIDTDNGPFDVSFPAGNVVNIFTPSNSMSYPNLQYRVRGQGYIVYVTVWADENGDFPVPVNARSDNEEGKHFINIKKGSFGKNQDAPPTIKASIIRSCMIAANLAVAREPGIRVRAENRRINDAIGTREREVEKLRAELARAEAELSALRDAEDAIHEQMLAPIDPMYTEPGIHLKPVAVTV